jgi:hypothetical protein
VHNGGSTGFASGPFGTVELTLVSGKIDVSLSMLPNWVLINTGFAGTFGFNDNFELGDISAGSFSSPNYSGSANNGGSDPAGDLNFDGFGTFDNAAATTGPSAGSANAISNLSFVISRTLGFTSVQQLVELNTGGDGSAYFVADVFDKACGAANPNGGGACTGLVGVSTLNNNNLNPVPEPSSYLALLGAALAAMVFVARRKRTDAQPVQ